MKTKWILLPLVFVIFLNVVLYGFLLFITRSKGFFCPVPKEYCKSGKVIKIQDSYLGLGYELPAETPVFAIFPGLTSEGIFNLNPRTGGGRYPYLSLADSSGQYIVEYILTGEDFWGGKDVLRGDEITKTCSGEISDFGINLLMRVRKNEEGKYKVLELSKF